MWVYMGKKMFVFTGENFAYGTANKYKETQ